MVQLPVENTSNRCAIIMVSIVPCQPLKICFQSIKHIFLALLLQKPWRRTDKVFVLKKGCTNNAFPTPQLKRAWSAYI